jgi:nitrogen fixation-related uncharacterized protein
MKLIYLLIWGSMLLFGGSAVCALVWAIKDSQMSDPIAGARSIFDEDEPIGTVTDGFPESDR